MLHRRLLCLTFVLFLSIPTALSLADEASAFKPADFNASAILVVHYHRPAGNYDDWNLWSWAPGADGRSIAFDRTDSFGRIAIVPFADKPARAGIIVRRGDWKEKDIDQDRFVDFDAKDVREVWLVSGDPAIYDDPSKIDLTIKPQAAFLDALDTITLGASGPLDDNDLRKAVVAAGKSAHTYEIADEGQSPLARGVVYTLKLQHPIDAGDVGDLSIKLGDQDALPIAARGALDDPSLAAADASLGCNCDAKHSTFTTWSPVSTNVELLLYDNFSSSQPKQTVPMQHEPHGLWQADIAGDLQRKPYRYRFTRCGQSVTAADIYCYAASPDSRYSVAVDLDRLKPDGFDATSNPVLQKPTDEILYELHTRDFSIADDTCPKELRGTYLGLVHSSPQKGDQPSRGLDHLKDLGITAIHLMPVEQFGNTGGQYNWGYWTSLFDVPEADYSTDPADPLKAIVELRQAITTLHQNHIRLVMDVVYNHAASAGADSPFEAAVPGYFFRQSPDGRLVNDTGVGNTLADERLMVRKFIVDSLKHWQLHYHVDGFRFDLLGCEHPETVHAICDALVAQRPDVTLYGEPWTGGGPVLFGKGAQRGMHVAVFNDNFRSAIRGDLNGKTAGFATGDGSNVAGIQRGVDGSIDDFTSEPAESINYVDCHDDMTLWDKLTAAHPDASEEQKVAMQKLALGIVLTSQGVAFLHGGSDFCQTKNGIANSYNSGDAVNEFDWQRKAHFADLFNYVRGLIALRRAHPAFRISDAALIRSSIKFLSANSLVAYTIDGSAAGDEWPTLFVAYNGQAQAESIDLPAGSWQIVADDKTAGNQPIRQAQGTIEVAPESMIVAHE